METTESPKSVIVRENHTDEGVFVTVEALGGLTFEDGEATKEFVLSADHGPRIGERVFCGKTLVKVAQRRYDGSHRLWLLDEDTNVWFRWRQ